MTTNHVIRPILSHIREMHQAGYGEFTVRKANISVIIVEGHDADQLGGRLLQAMADKEGTRVIVSGPCQHHGERIFHPQGDEA